MRWQRRLRPWLLTPDNPPGSYEALLALFAARLRDGRLVLAPRPRVQAAVLLALVLLAAGLVTAGVVINVRDSPARVAVHHFHRRVRPDVIYRNREVT